MRLHDRRAGLAALVLFAAYLATFCYGLQLLLHMAFALPLSALPQEMDVALLCTAFLMVWRLGFRFLWSTRAYGWKEGFRSIPRVFVGNIIAMMAARRAIGMYIRQLAGGAVVWDKTRHQFPAHGTLGGHRAA